MTDERAHGECVGMHHAEDEIARLQAENDVLAQRLAAVEKERDAFERKGKDLCIAHGNALVTIHDLQTEHARLTKELQAIKSTVGDEDFYLRQENARLKGEVLTARNLADLSIAIIDDLQQQLAAAQGVCEWTEDEEGNWSTACGGLRVLDGAPSEHRMRFCSECGKPLAERRYQQLDGKEGA